MDKNKLPKLDFKLLGIVTAAVPLAALGFKALRTLARKSRRKSLRDQVVVITGASTGIGKSYAIALAREGAKIVLAARTASKIEELAEEIKVKYNVETLAVPTDVSKEEEARNLIERALDRFGHIDILINNAGIATYGYFHNNNIEDLKKIMDVNFWGAVYCTHAVIPSMITRGKGKIVNISSFVGKRAVPVMAGYSASKYALGGFSESLRVEVKKYGIDVTVIYPTSTRTEIVNNALDTGKIKFGANVGMTSDRVARETINAILDNKRDHVIGIGENIALSINNRFPSLVDRVLTVAPRLLINE
jgi:short-subunit dehydrogenase